MREYITTLGENLSYMGPEVALFVGIFLILVTNSFLKKGKEILFPALALVVLTIGFAFEIRLLSFFENPEGKRWCLFFDKTLIIDPFASLMKILLLIASAVVVVLSYLSYAYKNRYPREYYTFLLGAILASCLMVSAADFLLFFLVLELFNFCLCFSMGFARRGPSLEGAVKFMIYSGLASAMMLYGFSLLYGLTGSTRLTDLSLYLTSLQAPSGVLLLALFLSLAGAGAKLALLPFHFWAPDSIEGAPSALATQLVSLPKIAALAFIVRFTQALGPLNKMAFFQESFYPFNWYDFLALLGAATLTFGNLAALWQVSLKRLLAYFAIGQSGYILLGISVFANGGNLSVLLFYLVLYLVVILGIFTVILLIEEKLQAREIPDYYALGYRAPFLAFALALFLFSVMDLPPLVGFWGKFILLGALIQQESYWLVLLVGANILIGAYYCLRIIKTMYFVESADDLFAPPLPFLEMGNFLVILHLVAVGAFGLFFHPVLRLMGTIRIFPS